MSITSNPTTLLNRVQNVEQKTIFLQQSDSRYPYEVYDSFPVWIAARVNSPHAILLADTDTTFSQYTSQGTALTFAAEGRYLIGNTGVENTLWIKIGNDYVYIIPGDKAIIIVKGGKITVL